MATVTQIEEKAQDIPIRGWKDFQKICQIIAEEKSEWAGMPVPLDDLELILENRYPYKALQKINLKKEEVKYKVINRWYSRRKGVMIGIYREVATGKIVAGYEPNNQIDPIINTIGASRAWSLDCELKANLKMASLLPAHMCEIYYLTGTILESSPRSGITYVFRKLRPTIALKKDEKAGSVRALCALCSHPIGYYHGSWGGVMCPTDDVIAALLLMRGDESRFWKQCNQHSILSPLAGM